MLELAHREKLVRSRASRLVPTEDFGSTPQATSILSVMATVVGSVRNVEEYSTSPCPGSSTSSKRALRAGRHESGTLDRLARDERGGVAVELDRRREPARSVG